MHFLLDTDTCIHLLKGHATTLSYLSRQSSDKVCLSTITTFELYTGIEKCSRPTEERGKVELLLDQIAILPFDDRSAAASASIRATLEAQGQMIGPYDVLIAGQAQAHSLTVVTKNVREFSRVSGLVVENWSI